MKSAEEYRESLRDGRRIYAAGRRVEDPATHPLFASAVEWISAGYAEHYVPEEQATAPYFDVPRSSAELHDLLEKLLSWDMVTVTTSQGLLALLTAAARMRAHYPDYAARIDAYFAYCRDNDLRCVQAITDAKGHRRLSPGKQDDPDLYTHVVEERADGIVVSGAKLHISAAALAHEMVVMPTKKMKVGEEEWAVACGIPVNAPGVSVVNTTYAPREDPEHFPHSAQHNMPEGFVLLDRVFVPNDRVFLCGEVEHSPTFAHSLGLWERLGGTAHLAEGGDLLVGLAQLIAEANGLEKVPHIRDKIAEMIIYTTLVRGSLEAAISNARSTPEGWVYPDELFTNAAKHHGAAEFSLMVRHLHDIGGGSILTAPTMDDLRNTEVGPLVEKYMRTMDGVSGHYRMRLFHTIRDLTADAYGGWQLVTMLQSGGGLFAQRQVVAKHYDMEHAKQLALDTAGLDAEGDAENPVEPT